MTIPCKDCITLAICRSYVFTYMSDINQDEIDNAINFRTRSLSRKCSLIKGFIYSDGGTFKSKDIQGNMKSNNLLNLPRVNNIVSYFLEYTYNKDPYLYHRG